MYAGCIRFTLAVILITVFRCDVSISNCGVFTYKQSLCDTEGSRRLYPVYAGSHASGCVGYRRGKGCLRRTCRLITINELGLFLANKHIILSTAASYNCVLEHYVRQGTVSRIHELPFFACCWLRISDAGSDSVPETFFDAHCDCLCP